MAHDHTHTHEHENDTYYLDQLCLIALSAAFAGVCLTLYFWQTRMLGLMLAEQFHPFVLWSGVALAVLVAIRAVTLWHQVGQPAAHHHHHGCCGGHEHSHAHAEEVQQVGVHSALAGGPSPALSEHSHSHDAAHHHHHDHDHAHGHDHHHGHDHGHDHGWAPWRYVVLLLPIMLYLLGLPNKGPAALTDGTDVDLTEEAVMYASVVGSIGDPFGQVMLAAASQAEHSGPAKRVDFKELEGFANTSSVREFWRGKRVQVLGQFAPSGTGDRFFTLVRFRMQCCAADAIPLRVPMYCKESLAGFQPNDWVLVTGRVEFQQDPSGRYMTRLKVNRRSDVKPHDPDNNFYLQ
jgi:hypothetical protein